MIKTKIKKNYKYISVEGIDNQYLDACLLLPLPKEQICKAVSDEKALIAKTNLSLVHVIKQKPKKGELIREISPYMNECYTVYNWLISSAHKLFNAVQETYIDPQVIETEEDFFTCIEELIAEGHLSYYVYVTWLRIHEAHHHRIQSVLEKYGNRFQMETGIRLPEEFEVMEIAEDELGEDAEDDFDLLIDALTMLKEKVKEQSYKSQYDEEKKKREQFEQHLESMKREYKKLQDLLKSKEQATVKKDKEVNQLKKSLETKEKQLEKSHKDIGQLSKQLGELRPKIAAFETQNSQYQKDISRFKENKDQALQALEERLSNQFRLEKSLAIEAYQKQIGELQRENKSLYKQMEDYQLLQQKVSEHEDEVESLKKQLAFYVERFEKQELSRETKAPAPVPTTAKVQETQHQKDEFDEFDELESFLSQLGKNEPKQV